MSSKSFYGLIISLFSLLFISCATLSTEKTSSTKFSNKYKTLEIKESSDYLITNIKYPEFEDSPELNKRISNTILNNWKNFKSYSNTEWNDVAALNNRGITKLPPFEYMVIFEVTGNKNIISVLLNTYIFNGGAHGNTTLTTLNYDTEQKKFIDIQEASGLTYNEISSSCRNTLYKKLIDDNNLPPSEIDSMREMINTGAFPQAGNFELFTLDGNNIYVWFEPYSVAPYSYGIQKVLVK